MKKIYHYLVITLLLCCLGRGQAEAQQKVSGTVVSANDNIPQAGATVKIKDSTIGTTTDANGKFSITATAESILVVSFIGFKPQELKVGGRSVIDVRLETENSVLNEVVVVGYGTQRKIATTGSIASVKAAELKQTPIVNVAQGLQARVAGVQVTQNSGSPGGNISVRVRGINSINGTSEPLYIVDGIQISGSSGSITSASPLSTINPNDIESIEILKDASSTAIYGSRAANGVVLITTKQGQEGTTKVSYESYYGVQKVAKKIDLMNATQFVELENDVNKRFVVPSYSNPSSFGTGTDWQDVIFRDAAIQNHQLSISGGNKTSKFAIAGNFFNQEGVIKNSDFTRYSLRFNFENKISDFVKVGLNMAASQSIDNRVNTDGDEFLYSFRQLVNSALLAPPNLSPYTAEGGINYFANQFNGIYQEVPNPTTKINLLNRIKTNRLLANIFGEFNLIKGLTYRASFNIDAPSSLSDFYSPISNLAPIQVGAGAGNAVKGNNNVLNMLHESLLTYQTNINEQHSLTFTGLFASQVNTNNGNTINTSLFPNDLTNNEAVQLAKQVKVNSYRSKEQLVSYMGRINYGFKDKYFVDLTARVDGSSKFGANNKYGFFPAVSVAWRIMEEGFMKNISAISDLKLRASYGITGNSGGLNPYQSLALVGTAGNGYNFDHTYNGGPQTPTGIPNPDLGWESSKQTDIGIDASFLNNRLSIVADWYNKVTDGLIYSKNIPISSGFSTIQGNFANLQNTGFEFALNGKVLTGKLKLDIGGNISFNKNKLLSIDGVSQESFSNGYQKVGEPLGAMFTYVWDGIYQTGENILPGSGSRIGGVKVKDLNGDGQITAADRKITGYGLPKYTFGMTANASYKGFDLSAFIQGVQGNTINNLMAKALSEPAGGRNNLVQLVNRWTPTNPSNEYAGAAPAILPITDHFQEDGSFVRIKNLTLGYTLTKLKVVRNVRVYVSGNNLLTFTKYTGYDPEVNNAGGSNVNFGQDDAVYPLSKTYLVGLQVNF